MQDTSNKKELSGESSVTIIPRKTKTIKLQGKDYAQVSDRVAEFNKLYPNGSVKTSYELLEGWWIFKAIVTLDVKNETRIFTGTSMGKVGAVKAFEKLETIAVGRALAFAGFLSDGEIASSDEMRNYEEAMTEVNTDMAIKKLTETKSLDELKKVWANLTQAERDTKLIETYKDQLKKKYEDSPSRPEKPGVARATKGQDNGDGVKEDSRVKVA